MKTAAARPTRFHWFLTLPAMLAVGCASWTPVIAAPDGQAHPGSVAYQEVVSIGGVPQWLLVRGRSDTNPILLVIHGGPGSSEAPLVRRYNRVLEEHFIVAIWDQRGAGKSFSRHLRPEDMTIERFVSDAAEVITLLTERYHKEKVYILGHSWGSMLGILVAQKYPQRVVAYIGTGQAVNGVENERLSFAHALRLAEESGNRRAVRELNALNTPEPYWKMERGTRWFQKLRRQRQWLLKLGGSVYGKSNYSEWVGVFLKSPEYTLADLVRFINGTVFTINSMWPEIIKEDLFTRVPRLEVPVYILQGRHDCQTPYEIAERYFAHLDAPCKRLIWFERSAHSPMFEEPEEFNRVLVHVVLGETSSHSK